MMRRLTQILVPNKPVVVEMICQDLMYLSEVVRAGLWKKMPMCRV